MILVFPVCGSQNLLTITHHDPPIKCFRAGHSPWSQQAAWSPKTLIDLASKTGNFRERPASSKKRCGVTRSSDSSRARSCCCCCIGRLPWCIPAKGVREPAAQECHRMSQICGKIPMTCDLQSVNRVLEKQQPLISSMKKL